MMRGKVFAAVLVILVCGVAVANRFSVLAGCPSIGWLKALNISARKSSPIRSLSRKVLEIPESKLNQRGPRRMLTPEVPSRNKAPGVVGSTGTVKHVGSNHLFAVGS